MSERLILSLQVSGFVVALALLPFMHGLTQKLFVGAFAVHFVGDIFRVLKDHVN